MRKTSLTLLDDAGLPARLIADQAGHSQVSMMQDVVYGSRDRGSLNREGAGKLARESTSMHNPCTDLGGNVADTA